MDNVVHVGNSNLVTVFTVSVHAKLMCWENTSVFNFTLFIIFYSGTVQSQQSDWIILYIKSHEYDKVSLYGPMAMMVQCHYNNYSKP